MVGFFVSLTKHDCMFQAASRVLPLVRISQLTRTWAAQKPLLSHTNRLQHNNEPDLQNNAWFQQHKTTLIVTAHQSQTLQGWGQLLRYPCSTISITHLSILQISSSPPHFAKQASLLGMIRTWYGLQVMVATWSKD